MITCPSSAATCSPDDFAIASKSSREISFVIDVSESETISENPPSAPVSPFGTRTHTTLPLCPPITFFERWMFFLTMLSPNTRPSIFFL